MNLSFRWFGQNDPVALQYIRQIPGVQSIVHDLKTSPLGELIEVSALMSAKNMIEAHGMEYKVYESLGLHPSIKMGTPDRDKYIENYKRNLESLAALGIKVVVYNFRPIIRWARTDIGKLLEDKSTVSVYYQKDEHKLDPFMDENQLTDWHKANGTYVYKRQLTTDMLLEGYYNKTSRDILIERRKVYRDLGKEGLWENLSYFLKEVIPRAQELGIQMAMHPDDPPWDIFGIPRLIINEAAIDRLLAIVDSPSNGLVFCSGTIASNSDIDVIALAEKYLKKGRIPFAHIRNVKSGPGFLEECAHYTPYGSINMAKLMKVFVDYNYEGYIRSDHGRMIWGEEGKPGNGMYDRALGAQYILGLWEALNLSKSLNTPL
jgi:mannonate dehydratase